MYLNELMLIKLMARVSVLFAITHFFIVICHFSQKKFDVFLNLMKKTLICNDIAIVSVEGNYYRLSNNVAIIYDYRLLITDCC